MTDSAPVRVAIPSGGRLRDFVIELLDDAGYPARLFAGTGARATVDGMDMIEMRPRDAAVWLKADRFNGAFISTDIVLEEGLQHMAALELGSVRSDLVLASRDDDGRAGVADLAGAVVATHLPNATAAFFAEQGIEARVVSMGGSLEGVCAAGLADAIVDLRQTGTSLAANRLRVLATIAPCQALFVHDDSAVLQEVELRLTAVLEARRRRYVMLHLHPDNVGRLAELFPGLEAPTVLPLAFREDLVAVHLVAEAATLWARLSDLRALGASSIVALPPDALLP